MGEIINSLRSLFMTYGFRAGAVIVSTIIIVNLIKKPIVKKAEERQKKTGEDKSLLTKYVTALPIAVALVLELFAQLIVSGFSFRSLDFGTLFSSAILYGALATATYESVKKQLKAYSASLNSKKEDNGKVKIGFSANGPEN